MNITASILRNYTQCPHRVWQDVPGLQGEKIQEANLFIRFLLFPIRSIINYYGEKMTLLFRRYKNEGEIPEIYLKDYLSEWTLLIKNRLRLSVFVFLAVLIGTNCMSSILMFGRIGPKELLTWGLLICVCAAVLVLARKASNIHSARTSAMLFVGSILIILTGYYIVSNTDPYMPIIVYVFVLFGTTLAIPLKMHDIAGLALLYDAAYTVYFLNIQTYVYKNQIFSVGSSDFLQGLIFIMTASIICLVISRREKESRVEKFIILKDVESKNKQMQEELELATCVHKRLIPQSVSTRLADIAVTYVPVSFMGGDYAKFHFIGKDKLIFIICDVTGHGVSAALLVNALNSEFELLAKEGKSPGDLLKELDRFIVDDFAGTNMYLTAFCGLLDYGSVPGKFIYSNYGHPPQYIYRTAKPGIEKIPAQTSLLGLPIEDENIYQNEISFDKKDQILLFTDGIIEAKDADGIGYGPKRLENFIEKNNGLQVELFNQQLLNELNSFTGNTLKDDVFILNIKTK